MTFRIHKSGRMGFYVGSYPLCWKQPRSYDINKCGITDVNKEVNCPRCLKLIRGVGDGWPEPISAADRTVRPE